jgi:hypothetical protein
MSSTAVMGNQSSAALIKSSFWNSGFRNQISDAAYDSAGNVYTLNFINESLSQNTWYKWSLQKMKADGTHAWTKIMYQSNDSTMIQNYPWIKSIDDNYLIFGGSNATDGLTKAYVSKLNSSDGSVVWAKNFSNTDNRGYRFFGCHIDESKNLYLSRYDLNGWPMIYKLDYNGNLVWAKGLSASFADSDGATVEYKNYRFTGNSSGQTVWIGNFYGNSITYGSSSPNKYQKQSTMVFSLDSSGNVVFIKYFKPLETQSVHLDNSGNIIMTGRSAYYNSTTAPNPSTGNLGYDFLLKLNSSGTVTFYKTAMLTSDQGATWINSDPKVTYTYGLVVDNLGDFYRISVAPNSGFVIASNGGTNKPYLWISKFDSSGTVIWENLLRFSSTYPNTGSICGVEDPYNNSVMAWAGKPSGVTCSIENNKLIIPFVLRVNNTSGQETDARHWNMVVKLPTDGSKLGTYLPATYITMYYEAQDASNKTPAYSANSTPVVSSNTASLVTFTDTVNSSPTAYTILDSTSYTTITMTHDRVPF